ncbi:MAG TPA: hypothetical protein VKF79_11510 [Candidatus Acidoferrum sp.]|nr:hypothetical protein [Candidatus Acidoferrum sp.]
MARGWESKDVESQVAAADVPKSNPNAGNKSDAQVRHEQEKKDLQLSRTRIVNELQSATHPQHRKSLEAALAHLDHKISEL